MRNFPTAFQRKTLWNAITGISILISGALVVGLIWLVSQILGFLQPVLVPLAMAGIIAYLLDPVVRFLQAKGIGRVKAIGVVFAAFLIGATLLLWTVLPPLYREGKELIEKRGEITENLTQSAENYLSTDSGNRLLSILAPESEVEPEGTKPVDASGDTQTAPDDSEPESSEASPSAEESAKEDKAAKKTEHLKSIIDSHSGQIADFAAGAATTGGKKLLGMLGFVFGLVMVPIYLFYFLKESSFIRREWRKYVPLRASKFKDEFVDTLQEINKYLIAFFRGQVVVSFIDGVLTGVVLTIVGLDYAIVIGVCLAFLGIIPYIGIILTFLPAAAIAFATGTYFTDPGWSSVGLVAIIFFVVQQFDGFVIQPKIVGDSTGLHPMTVIFSVLFWSLILGGFLGALLAVPLTAAVKVIARRLIWQNDFAATS